MQETKTQTLQEKFDDATGRKSFYRNGYFRVRFAAINYQQITKILTFKDENDLSELNLNRSGTGITVSICK